MRQKYPILIWQTTGNTSKTHSCCGKMLLSKYFYVASFMLWTHCLFHFVVFSFFHDVINEYHIHNRVTTNEMNVKKVILVTLIA